MKTIELLKSQIDLIYKRKSIEFTSDFLDENEYVLITSSENSALAKKVDSSLVLINYKENLQGVVPKDSKQKCFFDSLFSKDVLMTVALGKAGTGKTLLSIAYALHEYFKKDKKIILIKPSDYVGGKSSVMGILPGDINDKLSGIMSSYMVHIKKLLGRDSEHFIYEMLEREMLMYLPVELARGMSLEDATVIFDESQNADIHIMKTIVSRVAASSKLICLGDLGQIDAPFKKSESGLNIFIESDSFKSSKHTSQITLTSQYRSVLADLCEQITQEYYGE